MRSEEISKGQNRVNELIDSELKSKLNFNREFQFDTVKLLLSLDEKSNTKLQLKVQNNPIEGEPFILITGDEKLDSIVNKPEHAVLKNFLTRFYSYNTKLDLFAVFSIYDSVQLMGDIPVLCYLMSYIFKNEIYKDELINLFSLGYPNEEFIHNLWLSGKTSFGNYFNTIEAVNYIKSLQAVKIEP